MAKTLRNLSIVFTLAALIAAAFCFAIPLVAAAEESAEGGADVFAPTLADKVSNFGITHIFGQPYPLWLMVIIFILLGAAIVALAAFLIVRATPADRPSEVRGRRHYDEDEQPVHGRLPEEENAPPVIEDKPARETVKEQPAEPVQEIEAVGEISPVEEPPVQQPAPQAAEQPVPPEPQEKPAEPAEEKSSAVPAELKAEQEVPAPVKEIAAEKTPAEESALPAEQTEEVVPVDEVVPIDEVTPAEDIVIVEEIAATDETETAQTPAEEEKPAEEQTPAEEEKLAEEQTPAEEEKPAEEKPAEEEKADKVPVVVTEDGKAEESDEFYAALEENKKYDRSFRAKLIQASDVVKERYGIIYNALMAYKGVKSRYSWDCETFKAGGRVVAKVTIIGKTPVLFLALDPSEYIDTKYRAEDASKYSKYAATPAKFKINGERKAGYARELIARAMEEFVFEGESETLPEIPYQSDEELLQAGLIKTIK